MIEGCGWGCRRSPLQHGSKHNMLMCRDLIAFITFYHKKYTKRRVPGERIRQMARRVKEIMSPLTCLTPKSVKAGVAEIFY